MDAINSAVSRVGAERQLTQVRTNAEMVREAHRGDAAVVELLDAAKATEASGASPQSQQQPLQDQGPGQVVNFVA